MIYLGIWQASLDGHLAVVRPWRLAESDLRAVARAAGIEGAVLLRATETYSVASHAAPRASFFRSSNLLRPPMQNHETIAPLLEAIRRFVNERLIPLEAKVAADDAIPADALEEMRALGLFGLSIPEDFGGLGLSMEGECEVMFEFCRCSPAFRSAFGTMSASAARGWSCSAARRRSRNICRASLPVKSSPPSDGARSGLRFRSVRTKAVLDGDAYVLNGAKRFITNAARASLFTVMARTDPEAKGGAGVTAFLAPRDLLGLIVGKPEKKMGQQAPIFTTSSFENVRVPVENRLGEEGQGLPRGDAGARSRTVASFVGMRAWPSV